jgi:hypothetical protein
MKRSVTALVAVSLLGMAPAASAEGPTPPPNYLPPSGFTAELNNYPSGYMITVGPDYGCGVSGATCSTTISVKLGDQAIATDDDFIVTQLIDTTSQQPVPGYDQPNYYNSQSDFGKNPFTITKYGYQLPSGSYALNLDFVTLAHWWCSKYNSEGCSWMDGRHYSVIWRFDYTAGSTITALPWTPRPAPPATPPPDPDDWVNFHLETRRPAVTHHGRTAVRLRCGGWEQHGPCRGTIRIRTRGRVRIGHHHRKTVATVAARRFKLEAGHAKRFRFKLSARDRRLVKRASGRMRIVVKVRDDAGNHRTLRTSAKLKRAHH